VLNIVVVVTKSDDILPGRLCSWAISPLLLFLCVLNLFCCLCRNFGTMRAGKWRGRKAKGAAGNGACRTHAALPPVTHRPARELVCVNALLCACVCMCGRPGGKVRKNENKENKENNAWPASLHIYLSCQVIPCNCRNCVKLFNKRAQRQQPHFKFIYTLRTMRKGNWIQ